MLIFLRFFWGFDQLSRDDIQVHEHLLVTDLANEANAVDVIVQCQPLTYAALALPISALAIQVGIVVVGELNYSFPQSLPIS